MLQKIIQSFFTKGIVAVINFIILIVSSKYLGVSTRGEISLLILNIAIIQMVNEVYTGYSLVHFVSKFNIKKIYLNGLLFTLIISGVSNLVLLLVYKQPIGYTFLLFILSFIIILNTFNCVLILSKEYYKMYNILSVLQPLLLLMGIFYFTNVCNNYTLDAFIWPLIFSFSASFIFSTYFIFKFIFNKVSTGGFEIKPILKNGLYCQLAVLMYILSGRLSYYLLETKPDVGLYATSASLIESVLIITNSITPILLSRIAILGSNKSSIRLTLTFAKLCFIFSFLAIVVIYFIPNSVFTFLLGNTFKSSKYIMLLLSPGIIFLSFSGIISHYFSGIGNLKMVSFYNFFGFITTLILAPILIQKMGIVGAALTTNCAYFVTFVVSIIVFIKSSNLSIKDLFSIKSDLKELKQRFSEN